MHPQQFKIALVGEAWGRQEEIYRRPFVGAAGNELNRLLEDAEIIPKGTRDPFASRAEVVYITNAFNLRPPVDDNNIQGICVKRKDLPAKGVGYKLPALTNGWYVKPEYLSELDRLREELETVKPNLVVALGATALWALTQRVGIDKFRGAILESSLVPGLKVIATYHPASLFRVWNRRAMVVADLQKAKEESQNPSRGFVSREVWLEPTLAGLTAFEDLYLKDAKLLSVDIETPNDGIACIAIAPDPYHCIVVPFEDERKPAHCYWATKAEEIQAWRWVKRVLEGPIAKLGQNFMFDWQWLYRAGVYTRAFEHDTMLLHHSLQPEEKKGLGVLASLYVREDAFKQMGKAATKRSKRDG